MVEHLFCNHEVIGSTPIAGSSVKPQSILDSLVFSYISPHIPRSSSPARNKIPNVHSTVRRKSLAFAFASADAPFLNSGTAFQMSMSHGTQAIAAAKKSNFFRALGTTPAAENTNENNIHRKTNAIANALVLRVECLSSFIIYLSSGINPKRRETASRTFRKTIARQ